MKKVKWTWDWGCYVPLCPYCNELVYEKDHCVFCGKEYEWVDKSKDRKVEVGEYTVVQTSNNNIHIYKGERMVFHASCTKRKSEIELKDMVGYYESIKKNLKENAPKGNARVIKKFTYKGDDDE